MTLSRKVIRLFKKRIGSEDIDSLFREAGDVAVAVPEDKNLTRQLLAGLPALCADLDEAYAQYDERIRVALHSLQLSSEELGQANFSLEKLNASIKTMLESLGQGFLFFDGTGVCSPVFSKACLDLLEKDPANKPVVEVLGFDQQEAEGFGSLLSLVFDMDQMALDFEDLVGLAPQRYRHSKGRIISLAYRPMHNAAGAVTNILLIATDITSEVEAQVKIKQQEAQVMRLLRIARNRDHFTRYLHNCTVVAGGLVTATSLEQVKRDLHTLKGMGKMFFLDDIAELLHALEDALEGHKENSEKLLPVMRDYQAKLKEKIEKSRGYGREIWGDSFENQSDVITVDTKRLLEFGRKLQQASVADLSSGAAVRDYFEMVASVPVLDLFGVFEAQALYSADSTGKQIAISREGDAAVRVFPDFYKELFDSFVHIARNIIDHAADGEEERKAKGKPPKLQIVIHVAYADPAKERLMLTISDDGKGIDPVVVREKLKNFMDPKEIAAMSDVTAIQHIFSPGFSTKNTVDINAGRGVGMNAVQAAVEKLGGAIRVESELTQGTKFVMDLPVITASQQGAG